MLAVWRGGSRGRRPIGRVGLLLGLLGLGLPGLARAQAPTPTVGGQVQDRTGAPVAGLPVTLAGSVTAATVTDAAGRFAFPGLAAGGTYTVTPAQAGWVVAPVDATVAALAHDRLDLRFVVTAGHFTRYFAEGATSAFFDTQLALLNPTGEPTTATVRFQPAAAAEVTTPVTLAGHQRVTLDPKTLGLPQAEFATVIEADQPLLADRTMTWDGTGYGSHAETSLAAPQTAWVLAEGATIAGFDLFYLLQNPGDTPAAVAVRYLLPAPTPPLLKTYTVAPRSRRTIWVNQEDPALAAAEVSAAITVTNGVPIIVERAMYRPVGGQLFGAGHESAAVPAPARTWYFAEGATGPFFDLFFLLANPSDQPATVEARYLKPDGTVVTRTYAVAPTSRLTVWVDQEGPALADTAVATTFTTTTDVPVVIERAMWWGDAAGWREGHNAAGATTTGTTWGLAEGEVGGPRGVETYLLIGNPADRAGTARVTLTFEDGSQAVREVALPPTSRSNVAVGVAFPEAAGRRFGAVVASVGAEPVPLIVERAMYHSAGGVVWAAGTSAMGTVLVPAATPADAGTGGPAAVPLLPPLTGPVHLPAPATAVRDPAHATTTVVGPAGGTVTATAGDGTTYALAVPRGALRTPTAITLTPVTALTGLPVPVDLVAAVHGAPDGLHFALPAKLTITLPQPSTGVLLGLVIPDGDATLALTPVAHASATTLTIPVAHFSTIAIPRASAALLALLPAGSPHAQAGPLARAAATSGLAGDAQVLLDHLIAWYDTRIGPGLFPAVDLGATDAVRLAWLAEFYAWDGWRALTDSLVGHVLLGGTPVRGRLTARATDGRHGAALVLGNAFEQWNTQCVAGTTLALPARLGSADRAARFAVLAEFYLDWLADNQADAVEVDQATAPNRDAAGIGIGQIRDGFCLREAIAVAAPDLAPGATGALRVTARTVFGAEPPVVGEVTEVTFEPDPTAVGGGQTAPTSPTGEVTFPITADANGQLHYRVCAYYRPPVEGASFVTLLYRFDAINCREAVTGVVVAPAQVTLSPGASQQFAVVVEGASNQAVTWTVDGGGTITPTGRFTSNGTEGTFFVRATSVEDPDAVGIAQITVRTNPPPPPPAYPCVDEPYCTYSGTWTLFIITIRSQPVLVPMNFNWFISSPEVRVYPRLNPSGSASVYVSMTCGFGGKSLYRAFLPAGLGDFTATIASFTPSTILIEGHDAYGVSCPTAPMTGRITASDLSFKIVVNSGLNITFSGSR